MASDGVIVAVEAQPVNSTAGLMPFSVENETKRYDRANTVTILDWDDTLLSSTELLVLQSCAAQALHVDGDKFMQQLKDLEERVIDILTEAHRHGQVIIITNAEAGWVEMSGWRCLPGVMNYMVEHNMRVVSARSKYGSAAPNQPLMWKTYAFISEMKHMFADINNLNILVVGDGIGELLAAHILKENSHNSLVKTVRLMETPTTLQLTEELTILYKNMARFCASHQSFNMMVSEDLFTIV